MAKILRGSIHWAELDPTRGHEQSGTRPVVILSNDVFNDNSRTVIAMAITSVDPGVPFPLSLELLNSGLLKKSWAKISQVRILSADRIKGRIGSVGPKRLEKLVEGLNAIIH